MESQRAPPPRPCARPGARPPTPAHASHSPRPLPPPQARRRALPVAARAASRELWYPGASAAPHLDGSGPVDRGFDPLGLSANPSVRGWMAEAELTNGRWAMAAVAGILFTDLFGLGDWWTAGAKPTGLPISTLVGVEVAVMAFLEAKRFESWKKTGYGGVAGIAPFDPMGMDSPEMRVKEVKNARLAMVAFLGFSSVAAVRGEGPLEALKEHLADPKSANIFNTAVAKEFALAVVALSFLPMVFEARKTLDPKAGDKEPFKSAIPY